VRHGVRNVAHFGRGGPDVNPVARAPLSILNTSCFTPASLQIVLKITHSIGRRTRKTFPSEQNSCYDVVESLAGLSYETREVMPDH